MIDDIHTVPINDLIDHEDSMECPCGPDAELVATVGGDRWQIIHHSLDGRERFE